MLPSRYHESPGIYTQSTDAKKFSPVDKGEVVMLLYSGDGAYITVADHAHEIASPMMKLPWNDFYVGNEIVPWSRNRARVGNSLISPDSLVKFGVQIW